MPSLTRVVIPHPIAGLPEQEVRAKADRAMEEILKALLGT
jgi:hypothetical protein